MNRKAKAVKPVSIEKSIKSIKISELLVIDTFNLLNSQSVTLSLYLSVCLSVCKLVAR